MTRLGDVREIATVHWGIAQIALERKKFDEAFPHVAEAYAIAERLDLADGISVIGAVFGQLLVASGDADEGIRVLRKSLDAYRKLGRAEQAAQVQGIIDGIGEDT